MRNYMPSLANSRRTVPKETSYYSFFKSKRAISSAELYIKQPEALRQRLVSARESASQRQIYLHLFYHPCNPSSREIQQLWHRFIFKPPNSPQLNHLNNVEGSPIPVDRMILAYSRAPNLGNLLSYRKICKRSGPKVSSFL